MLVLALIDQVRRFALAGGCRPSLRCAPVLATPSHHASLHRPRLTDFRIGCELRLEVGSWRTGPLSPEIIRPVTSPCQDQVVGALWPTDHIVNLKDDEMPKPIFIVLLIAAPIILGASTSSFWLAALGLVLIIIANPVVRTIRKSRYFGSVHFQALKTEIAAVVAEHNDVVNYVGEIRTKGSFEIGSSSTGQFAHLASFENTSAWNNRRDRNIAEYAPQVYNTSLQVVRSASIDPIKYLMKYFSIKPDQGTLAEVQRVADDIARLEEAVGNVKGREADIMAKINPPAFILKYYRAEFWNRIGVHLSPIEVPYPRYKFQYTSAGGNSGQTTSIELNTPTLDALSATLAEKIRWTKSAAGQRALMTATLRGQIKERDRFRCLHCGVSLTAEPHLLLEVDHIVPISKGGLSTPENLQTLCWRCNRSKGAKVVA